MTDKLKDLYACKWDALKDKLNGINLKPEFTTKPTKPLLISLENNDYENADIKLIIFGQ